jgi:hypothetical protein
MRDRNPEASPDQEPSEHDGPGLDRWIRPFFSDLALRPVLIVLVIVVTTLGAAVILLAVRGRSYAALAALLLVAWASADAVWSDLRRRRLGPASGLIAALWLLSGLCALGAVYLGF